MRAGISAAMGGLIAPIGRLVWAAWPGHAARTRAAAQAAEIKRLEAALVRVKLDRALARATRDDLRARLATAEARNTALRQKLYQAQLEIQRDREAPMLRAQVFGRARPGKAVRS